MPCTISPLEIKRVKGLGFLNNKGTRPLQRPHHHRQR